MGEVVHLYATRFNQEGVLMCPHYDPASAERTSLAFNLAPLSCGSCRNYLPGRAQCGKLPFRRECICSQCGRFCLEKPGRTCQFCGGVYWPVITPTDW